MTDPTDIRLDLAIAPLIPSRLADLATLFDQGGDAKRCWCSSFRVSGRDEFTRRPDDNRALLGAAAQRGPAPAPGLLAYRADRVVGWVGLAPRTDFDRLTTARVLAPVDDRPVWSIVCFVVGRRERGQGIARALLDAAIDHARAAGATTLEAYPAEIDGGRISASSAYKGTLSMFERAGFTVVARRQANRSTAVRPIVRLEL